MSPHPINVASRRRLLQFLGCEPAVRARCRGAGAVAIGSGGLDGISTGWPAILSGLKSMLESGTALAIPPSALDIEGFDRS